MINLYYDPKTNRIFEGVYVEGSSWYLRHEDKYFKLKLTTWIPNNFVMIGRLD